MTLLSFVQLEFTYAIGPQPGRYVVLPEGVEHDELPAMETPYIEITGVSRVEASAEVLVIGVFASPSAKIRFRKRELALEEREPVPLTLVTLIHADRPLPTPEAARGLLERWRTDSEEQVILIERVLTVLNTAICAHRAAARDPYMAELTREDARAIRLGYGNADEVARGEWSEMITAARPRERQSRVDTLKPTGAVAAALSGAATISEAEQVLLRARLDVAQGRVRAAAQELRSASELLTVELTEYEDLSAEDELVEEAIRCRERADVLVRETLHSPQDEQLTALESLLDDVTAVASERDLRLAQQGPVGP